MKLQITDIQFDFTTEDVGEDVDFKTLEERLQNCYVNRVFEVKNDVELADVISDNSGWLVNTVSYVEV